MSRPEQAGAVDNTWQAGGVANTNYNATTNWDTGVVPASAGNSAIFGAAGSGTVVVNSAVVPDAWTFNATAQAYTISGAQVTFGGAGVTISSGNDISIANALAGSGGVAQNGTGTLTLTGALSYTGLTSATNGGSILLGDATRSVTLPGNATINGGNLGVVNGSLGSGTITVTGTAVVVGVNAGLAATAGSATINNGGTLSFLNSGSAGTSRIANTGVLDFGNTATAANSVITTSAAALFQFRDNSTAANATLTLTGAGSNGTFGNNSTAANATITGGVGTTITFQGNSSAGAATIATSAGVPFDGTGTIFKGNASGGTSRQIVNAGGLLDISQANGGITIGSLEGAGVVGLGDNALTVGSNNQSTTFSGVIQNLGLNGGGAAGLTKTGTGTLTLSGTNTYIGATTVNGGTLSVNGSIVSSSGVTVNNGGALGGNGTVPVTVVNSGGALAPGQGVGTLTVNGNLTFNAGANYNVDVSTTADRTNVTGTATLAGTVNTASPGGGVISKQYTILTATGGRIGTFSAIANTSLPANLSPTLSYDANNVYLNLVLNFAAANGNLNANQQNVSNVLANAFNSGSAIPAAFTALNANGLSQASGQPGPSTIQAGLYTADQFIRTVFDNAFGQETSGGGAIGFAADEIEASGYVAKRKIAGEASDAFAAVIPVKAAASRWRAWAAVYGGNSRMNGDGGVGTVATVDRTFGVAAGATYLMTPNTILGFALGGASSNFSLDTALGSGSADSFNMAVYARHMMGAAYVAGALGYSWQNTSTDRTVTASGTDMLHASFNAQSLVARGEAGWRYVIQAVGITPYAGLQATTFYLPSYGESATAGSNTFALNYASKSVTATRGELGAKFDKAMLVKDGVFTLKAKTAWAHDWNTDRNAIATFQSLPAASFIVNAAAPSADAALLSIGGEMKWRNGWTLAANFDGEFSRATAAYAGKGAVRYVW